MKFVFAERLTAVAHSIARSALAQHGPVSRRGREHEINERNAQNVKGKFAKREKAE
jgi:hypothetical protein